MYNYEETFQIIKRFIENENSAHGAMLLNGEWGIGKTYLIHELEKELRPSTSEEQPFNMVRVSLFGKSNIQSIEQDIFEQVHTFISNPKVKLAAQIGKGFLKGALKIDLDNDGVDDSLTINLTQVNFEELISKDKRRYILVFDDIERCDIPYEILLGYINQFVEQDKLKVLVVGDKAHILAKEAAAISSGRDEASNPVSFKMYWEKLFSVTIDYKPKPDEIIASIVEEKRFSKNIDKEIIVRSIQYSFRKLDNYNFRNVGAIVDAYDCLLVALEPEQISNVTFMSQLFDYVAMMTVGYRSSLFKKSYEQYHSDKLVRLFKENSEPDSESKTDEEFYGKVIPTAASLLLPEDIIGALLSSCYVDRDKFQQHLKSTYFPDENTSQWLLASLYRSEDEHRFQRALDELSQAAETQSIKSISEIYHFLSMLCWLDELNIYGSAALDIKFEQCKSNLVKVIARDYSGLIISEEIKNISRSTGYIPPAENHQKMQEFKEWFWHCIDSHNVALKPKEREELFLQVVRGEKQYHNPEDSLKSLEHLIALDADALSRLDHCEIGRLRSYLDQLKSNSSVTENSIWESSLKSLCSLISEIGPSRPSLKNIEFSRLRQLIEELTSP